MDDEADHRESDTTHESEILMKQHITPGTYFQVIDDEEIERDDEEPTTNEPWNNSTVRGGQGIGTTMGNWMQSWYVPRDFIAFII